MPESTPTAPAGAGGNGEAQPSSLEQLASQSPEGFAEVLKTSIELIQSIALCLLILFIGWMVSKWAFRLTLSSLKKRNADEAVSAFLAGIAQYVVLAAAVIAALGAVGIETTSLVAVLGSAGIAVGLALQGNLAHFASGVMILFFRPFTIGHRITAGGHTGAVQDIGLFATTLHTLENHVIIVPNASITSGAIVNMSALKIRRGSISVGVAYGSDVDEVMKVLEAAAKSCSLILDEPGPGVAFVGLGASSLDFLVHCWSKDEDWIPMMHDARTAVYNHLNDAGIDIPYNQIVVHQAPTEG